ncbi:hypothetical protein EN801_020505 [Mesorhizobium sp. M00.F.Ca.ET.158.01.1.1]|nr:hypothetical protein EN801_020505 [Mesorhizobium sp. M00.F.Ca.ET.158.01.1.1]
MSMPIKTIEAEAERGAEHARAFLADNPTYADIQTVCEWWMTDETLAEQHRRQPTMKAIARYCDRT